jgi:hypothetical protein
MATGESPWMAARNQPWKPNNHLAPYTALPIASLKSGSYALARPKGEWLAVSAMAIGAMLGSAIAERQAGGAASQRCLWVDPAWRRQGMDTGLLNGPMRCADQEGIGALSPPYQAQELSQLGAPESLLPPADPRRIAPKGSLALLDQGDGAGWIRAERLSANIHHCRRLFVATQPQGRERGHALLATTFQRQQQTKAPISRAAVAANNHALQRLLKRQLKTDGTSLNSPRKASCRPRGAAG